MLAFWIALVQVADRGGRSIAGYGPLRALGCSRPHRCNRRDIGLLGNC
jgi:hypothetical protein